MTRYRPPKKIDLEQAQAMLDAGETVLNVALAFQVATASVYEHIRAGRLKRPEKEQGNGNGRGEAPTGAGAGPADAAQAAREG